MKDGQWQLRPRPEMITALLTDFGVDKARPMFKPSPSACWFWRGPGSVEHLGIFVFVCFDRVVCVDVGCEFGLGCR